MRIKEITHILQFRYRYSKVGKTATIYGTASIMITDCIHITYTEDLVATVNINMMISCLHIYLPICAVAAVS